MSTKKKIIEEALLLFAEKGYSDVYVDDIAKAVAIKAPSLYKHFRSKQNAGIYARISEESLVEIGKNLFLYFLHDDHMKLFRKLLTLEQ